MNRFLSLLVFCLITGTAACAEGAVTLRFDQTNYRPGDTVQARIDAPGRVLIESELSQTSSEFDPARGEPASLGRVREPGVYAIRIRSGEEVFATAVIALPEGEKFTLHTGELRGPAPREEQALLTRFYSRLDRARLAAAARATFGPWAARNAVALRGTAGICLIPGQQGVCAVAVGGKVIDLAVAVLAEAADSLAREGLLTAEEAGRVKLLLALGNAGVQVGSAQGLERLFAAAASAAEIAIDDPAGQMALKFTADEAGKTVMLLRVLK